MVEGRESLGPYRILRRLGVGGMAETFEAVRIDPSGFEQRVCLKRVLPAYGAEPGFLARFEREARLAARLCHSNVVAVLDFGTDEGAPYMALELVDGPDLRSFVVGLPGRRLPLGLALLVASDVAMALAYAHAPDGNALGVVHRDVSPSNVLLGRSGDVKLADFGIATAMDGGGATPSGEVRGKIPYMSPEQMRGQPVDGRADLFSLGVVLFELLAGVRPFDGAHDVETMTHILADERRRLEDLVPELPRDVVAIVDRLLASQPAERFPDAGALLAALEAAGTDARDRRALAAAVEATLGGMETREHLTSSSAPPPAPEVVAFTVDLEPSDAPPSATDVAAEVSTPPASPTKRRRRARPVLAAVTGSAIAIAAGFVVREPSRTPPPAATAEPARVEPKAAAAASRGPTLAATAPASAPPPASGPERATPPAPDERAVADERGVADERSEATGRLRVTVYPWGRVWVDGRPFGRAPRTLELARGDHLVQAGYERPIAARRVRIGEQRVVAVEFELE